MDFKTQDTIKNLKANTIGFEFKILTSAGKNEYDIISEKDCKMKYCHDNSHSAYASHQEALSFIENGVWIVIKTSNEHVHADVIRAYADGAQIQLRVRFNDTWQDIGQPSFSPFEEYRIKPIQKKLYKVFFLNRAGEYEESALYYANVESFKEKNHFLVPIGINPKKFIEVPETDPDFT